MIVLDTYLECFVDFPQCRPGFIQIIMAGDVESKALVWFQFSLENNKC